MAVYPRRKRPLRGRPETIARGLGWFSVGLGIAQVLAPRTIARLSGVPVPPSLMVMCGLRELACGIGLLTQSQPAPWIRARVAGDALDLAALAAGSLVPGTDHRRIAVAAGVAAAVTAVDLYCARDIAHNAMPLAPRHETVQIEIDRPPEELYRFWRELSNLPRFMPHLKAVEPIDAVRSRWVAAGPANAPIAWDSEIIDDRPGECIAWRSIDGSVVFNAGSVQFRATGSGGTQVRVDLLYDLPAGTFGSAVAQLFGRDPAGLARADLEAFKALVEQQKNPDNPRLMA